VDLAAVFAPADGTALCVGAEARRRAAADPSRYEPTPRLRVDEPDLLLGTRVVGVAEAWGAVLAGVLARAGPLLRGGRPRHLVLTHPAGWDGGRREVLRRAGSGLAEELTLVAEPLAVAAHAAWMRPHASADVSGPIAVLDLGAREASAAVVERGVLLAHRTDDRFGGDDADELLLGHLLASLAADPGDEAGADRVREVVAATTLADRRHRQVLLDDVRAAKEALSDAEQVAVPMPGRVTASWLSRAELTEVLRPALREVVDLLGETLADAGVVPERLASLWLTGGGARIPLLSGLVHRELGVPATVAPDPRLVVVRGALVLARQVEARRRAGAPSRTDGTGGAGVVGVAVGHGGTVTPERATSTRRALESLPPPRVLAGPGPRRGPDPPTDELPVAASPDPDPGVDDPEPAWLTPTAPGPEPAVALRARRTPPGTPRARNGARTHDLADDRTADLGQRLIGDDPLLDDGGEDWDEDPDDLTDPASTPYVAGRPADDPRLPVRHPTARPGRGPRPGLVIGVVVALVVVLTAVVLIGRAVSGPDGPTTAVGGQVFVAPPAWVLAGGDAASRRVLLRPADAPRGTDLVAVQENPLDGVAAADQGRARAQLAAQYDAARRAGDAVSGFEPSTAFADRPVARYRQDTSPGVRVDWVVVLSGPAMVSVGCRHGTEADDTARVLAVCEQVVGTLETAG
jgi:type VII secretion-associated protein (TIGR03931 family)